MAYYVTIIFYPVSTIQIMHTIYEFIFWFMNMTTDYANTISLFKKSLEYSVKALKNTQFQMEIYKKAATVDAGGYGFILLLEGFLEGLQKTYLPFEKDSIAVDAACSGNP